MKKLGNFKAKSVLTRPWIFVLLFGVVGLLALALTRATTPSISIELETGTLTSPAMRKTDSTASGGSYIQFGGDSAHNPSWVGCDNEGRTVSPPSSRADNVPIPYTGNEYRDLCPGGIEAIPEDAIITVNESLPVSSNLGQKLFTINCTPTHYLEEDLIVYPGRNSPPPVSHMHEFFGAKDIRGNSTLLDIVSKPNSCSVQADRSAYWAPAVYQDGRRIPASSNKFYYKAGSLNPNTTRFVQMPFGLQMIAGRASATSSCDIIPQSGFWYKYPYQERSPKVTHPHLAKASRCDDMFSLSSNPGRSRLNPNGLPEKLQVEIFFPQCWNGTHLWLPNTAHMTYAVGGRCPDSHPHPLMQVQYNLGYHGVTDTSTLRLASGEWYTFHADFINGWRPETLRKLTEACPFNPVARTNPETGESYGKGRYCGIGSSGRNTTERRPCSRSTSAGGCIEILSGREPTFHGTPKEGAANEEIRSESR